MAVEFNKVIDVVKIPLAVSVIFNFVLYLINLFVLTPMVSKTGAIDATTMAVSASIIVIALTGVNLLGNLALIAFAGFSAAKKGLDLISCGVSGAVMYTISLVIVMIITIPIGIMVLGTQYFANVYGGSSGIIIIAATGGTCLVGIVLNFVIGAVAGLIGGAR